MPDIKTEVGKIVAEINIKDMPNEWKKRTAFAKVNELLVANPTIKISNEEIDNMIEAAVNGSN